MTQPDGRTSSGARRRAVSKREVNGSVSDARPARGDGGGGGGIVGGHMELPPELLADLQRRLRRVEGQVRALQTMLAEGRGCRDVVTQVSAASKALDQVGFTILASGLATCLQDPAMAEAAGYSVDEVERMFLKLS